MMPKAQNDGPEPSSTTIVSRFFPYLNVSITIPFFLNFSSSSPLHRFDIASPLCLKESVQTMAKDKPGRWAHTWFNRFWKLLVRLEAVKPQRNH